MSIIEIFEEGDISLPYNGIDSDFISSVSADTLKHTGTENVSVTVILTDNKVIHEINLEYRGKDKATDVISFAYRDEPFPSPDGLTEELGDVYISLEKAAEQAVVFEVTLKDEVKRLLVHGILHLLGYDHERSPEDEKKMQEIEEKIINLIG